MNSDAHIAATTFLFTDIEGSTRLWEHETERMRVALARHDALARTIVEAHRGQLVKMSGDGIHAAFRDPLDAIAAAVAFQLGLRDAGDGALQLGLRTGLHHGPAEARDGDYYGPDVNRAARIMRIAYGGQILVSAPVAVAVAGRLPPGVEVVDAGRVRLRDLAAAEPLFQVCHPDLPRAFPPLRALESTPNNLPHALTSFVGRAAEARALRERLREHRLVLLHGAGGLGKTRLAREVAAGLLDAFPDGVWLVELAAVADPELVPAVVAATLGARDDGRGSASDALRRHVADRTLLIVLDNCEHLVEACARLARALLEAGPNLRILATSREPLRVAGEHAMVLAPLGMPPADFRPDDPALGAHEAIRLFCERAAAVQPAFALTPANASDVVDICRRLDGIALAIELAAARVRTLSPAAIRNALDDRFRLLTKGDATALPRQRTLRALIDWSFALLDATEAALFRRLSVFAGSFAGDAALAIGGDDGSGRDAFDDALHRLIEKSLVELDIASGRFRLLETVREYARDKLEAAGELAQLRTRHLRHFVTLAEAERPRLMGPAQGDALKALDAERENLLAAHAWCAEAPGGAELDLRLAYALKLYWVNRGMPRLGYGLAVEALARPEAQARTFLRCRGLTDAGLLGFVIGEYDAVAGYLSESLSIARELRDERRIVGALQPLGMTYLALGHRDRASECLVEAVERAATLGDPRELAAANNALAQLYRVDGAPERAAPLYDRVVALARQVDDRESIAIGLLNLAMVLVDAGALDQVPPLLAEVADIAAETGSKAAAQCVLDVCAGLASRRMEFSAAARFLAHGEALCREMGLRRDPADAEFVAAAIERVKAAHDGVLPVPEAAASPWRDALGDARSWLAAASAAGTVNPS